MKVLLTATILVLFMGCNSNDIKYPKTKKIDQVDDYFGTKVADPYRWLENDTAKSVMEWVDQQNDVTFNYLNTIPYRAQIKQRLTDIFNYERISSPKKVGEYYFFSKNSGLQNQTVHYYKKGLNGTPEVFLDPNTLSEDGTVSADFVGFSKDKKYVTVDIQQSGSDWRNFKVMEIATKKELKDEVNWVKFSGASWYKDGFFYSSYVKPEDGKEYSNKNEFHKVYYHKLGTQQSEDKLIYEDKRNPLRNFFAHVSNDERFLYIYESQGTYGTGIKIKDLTDKHSTFKTLFEGFDFSYSIIDNVGEQVIVHTNHNAPNYKLIQVDIQHPEPNRWKTLIPEKSEKLSSMGKSGGKLFSFYLKDATERVYQHRYDGELEHEIELPGLGSAHGFWGEKDEMQIFYAFSSFTTPRSIYKYDIETGQSSLFLKAKTNIDTENYETRQVFYKSKDGTSVPMFIVHKKGLKLDGTNPTYLYGYGGFNSGITPYFSSSNFILLEQGGIFALANIRGGDEYGEEWHKAGMLLNKQNVFDDFISAAEYLINEKYTSNEKLAISGASNGGLLVGASMVQRSDLFKVAFPSVGVLDMLRYHKFTIGWAWATEYGSSDSEEHFKNLYNYSPLHNLKKGSNYPATMVMTADHDDRVVPAHSFKFAAQLQEYHDGNNPVLIRISKKTGHGSGKPISMVIEEHTDKWAFMFYNMNMKYN